MKIHRQIYIYRHINTYIQTACFVDYLLVCSCVCLLLCKCDEKSQVLKYWLFAVLQRRSFGEGVAGIECASAMASCLPIKHMSHVLVGSLTSLVLHVHFTCACSGLTLHPKYEALNPQTPKPATLNPTIINFETLARQCSRFSGLYCLGYLLRMVTSTTQLIQSLGCRVFGSGFGVKGYRFGV